MAYLGPRIRCSIGALLGACSPVAANPPNDAATTAEDAGPASIDAMTDAGDPPQSIYAHAVGHTWSWTITLTNPTQTCDETGTVTGTAEVDGRHAFVVAFTGICPGGTSSFTQYHAVSADDRFEFRLSDPGSTWDVWDPPAEGHTWSTGQNGFLVYTWHATPEVSVPAGTFSDCWTATTTSAGSNQQFTYCRGVGEARSDSVFGSGLEQRYRLRAKNF